MGLTSEGGNGEWTGKVVIWIVKGNGCKIELNDLDSIKDVIGDHVRNKKLLRVCRWKEKCPEVQNEIESTALKVGVAGVGLVVVGCAVCAFTPQLAPALVAKGVASAKAAAVAKGVAIGGKVIGVGGAIMAGGGAVAGAAASLLAFHEFVVFECSDNTWVTVEKNKEQVTVQVCMNHDDSLTYANGEEQTRGVVISLVEAREMKPNGNSRDRRFTIEDIVREALSTSEYSCTSANCLHFTCNMMEKFGKQLLVPNNGLKVD